MCLFNLSSFVILVLIQSLLGNSIDNAESPSLLNHAHQEQVTATLLTTEQTGKDDKICEAISLQRVLSMMMTMLRRDLSENSKTAYLLETLKDLLKNTAANNKEVTDKVDDLLRTLDKYKEPVHENSLRTETDNPLRILVRKPTKPKEKLQFKYELPNLSNSYCTEALVNIAKIAYQAYASLAENPICNLPGFPDYPTKDTTFSNYQQSLDNPFLTDNPFQNILPAYPSNAEFNDAKFYNLKDFKNVLSLYNPINLQNRPGEYIPDVHEVPYDSNPLYPDNVDQDPFSTHSPDFPSDLYPDKLKYILNRPKEIPNGLNDEIVPYELNPLYFNDLHHANDPFYPQSQDTWPFYLYPHKQKHIPNRPDELLPSENDQEVPYESNPGDVSQVYNPFFPQRPNTMPYFSYSYKPHKNQPHPLFSEKPENIAIDIPLNNPNPIDIPLYNPNAPNKYPLNHFDYDNQLNPNQLELDVVPFNNPVNEYESKPFLNEDDEKPIQSPYDLIPETPPEVIPQDGYITPSNLLEDKDLKVLVFIRDGIDAIEGVNPAIEFDSQTLYDIEKIKHLLDNEDTPLEMNDYRVIVDLYKQIINYIKHLNGYEEIIDHIDLSRVTNSSKLENKKIELTYLLKRPKPVINYPYYYVKYRLPYTSFVNAAQHLIKPKLLRMNPNQYKELLTRSQVVETSPDLKHFKKHDLMGLIVQSGSLINAKLVGENLNLSDHLDALKDITSDLSAEELLKLNEDASSKLNLLAGNSGSVLFEPINEQSNRFKLQENNENNAIKYYIHDTTEPSADSTFDSTKLSSTLHQSEDVGYHFSDHSVNEHNLYQPSSNLPEQEKMSPVMYKLLDETINTGLRQNQQNFNSQANINNLETNQNTIYNDIYSSPENMAHHSNGASNDEELGKLSVSFDDQYFQPPNFVNQGADDYNYQKRLKDQQSVGEVLNQDNIKSSDGIMLQQITNQQNFYKNGLESLTQQNFSEPSVFGQQIMSDSNNGQAIPNQPNNSPWTNKESHEQGAIQQNYLLKNSANAISPNPISHKTGSYLNLDQQGQQNPRTDMWMNAVSGQQIIPSQQSYGQGIGMYPSNPSAFQQAIVSQQNLYNTNKAMYGQQNYNIGLNAKRYVVPLQSVIYKRPIINRYTPHVQDQSLPTM